MATTITMPQLGETVTEGTVERWLKKPGESIEKYEAFVEVSTDKVNSEVPAPVTGTLREILVQEGTTVATGTPIAVIDEVGAATSAASPPAQSQPTEPPKTQAAMAESANAEPVPGFNVPQLEVKPASSNGQKKAPVLRQPLDVARGDFAQDDTAALRGVSPAVRKLAREHQVDVRAIHGTGANGRVTADDVLAAAKGIAAGQAARTVPTAAPKEQPKPGPGNTSTYGEPVPGTFIALSSARRIIAERMVESVSTAPHAWTMVEVDVTNLWKWRAKEKDRFERDTGQKLTLLPFFIRAVVECLATYPLMNARFIAADGSTPAKIYVERDINIGIAIGLPTNLVVPVIKNADKLSIKGLAIAAGDLIERARTNKLTADDISGGTFTVNNNGSNGSYASSPIINGGQAGIVTMETVVKKPVVLADDSIAVRQIMNSCLSLDHRVVDGFVASGFMRSLKQRLESMGPAGVL